MKSNFPQAGDSRIVDIITVHRQEIYDIWLRVLREQWGSQTHSREPLLAKDLAAQKDLLSVVFQLLFDSGRDLEGLCEPLIHKIRRTDVDYSVFDVFLEASSLNRSWDEIIRRSEKADIAEFLDAGQVLNHYLCLLLHNVLHLTIDTYRYILESGSRAFCQIDADGTIRHANARMNHLLGLKNALGRRLEEFFQGSDREFVLQAYSGAIGRLPGDRRLRLICDSGHTAIVGAEIAPIYLNGTYQGGYACFVDLSRLVAAELETLNQTPFGVARADLEGRLLYANPRALEIFGMETWEGKTLWEVFIDPESRKIVADQLELRKKGLGDEYWAQVTRLSDRRVLPVKIYSRPETDLQGQPIGSLAMIRDLEWENAIAEMHKVIETTPNGQEVLQKVAVITNNLVPFDLFSISVYSADLGHMRRIFSFTPNHQAPPKWQVRWWEAPDYVVAWMKEHQNVEAIDDMEAFFNDKGWHDLKKSPALKETLETYRSVIRYPVIREDRVVAAVTIFSRKGPFSPYGERLERLPLDKAVIMALHHETKENLKFLLKLIEDISKAGHDIHHVAEVIVQRLAVHYEWGNVSLFRVDEDHKEIHLLRQKSQKKDFSFPPDYRQNIDEGILGYVWQHQQPVKIANVRTDPFFKDKYRQLVHETVSELCLPIRTSTGFWLLNIEDSEENAFSAEDLEALKELLEQVAVFLDRAWLHYLMDATLLSTSDLVIITNNQGIIKQVNPAVTDLLGFEVVEMQNSHLKDFFKDPLVAEDLFNAGPFPSEQVTLVGKSQEETDILLSASALPEELGGLVFIGKDLTLHERVKKLEFLGKMYYEVATQTKTPLSLAFSMIKDLEKQVHEPEAAALLKKTIKQLHKVELTLDRLATSEPGSTIFPYNEYLLDIHELLTGVLNDLPQSEAEIITVSPKPLPKIMLRGDLFQLSFCLATIFSYLLRFVPEKGKVACHVNSDSENLYLEIQGFFPGLPKDKDNSRALLDIALGQPVLEQILQKHRGDLITRIEGTSLTFSLTLPQAQEM